MQGLAFEVGSAEGTGESAKTRRRVCWRAYGLR